ncbi:MAG: peptidase BlaR1 [Ferruginibacter sp.]|uniref:M56 family metallopeptidase n=1 Tax=Ferruginibacter sp. TaxID=1940288 RepID=UPI00265ABA3E|nr:M56 family metallopeptidase [Ferruginibacter sp.]MDB5277886.1 peptidase BlaR1 [Ferruginibacter sp.]
MIPYILYAALILTACLVFYKLLLQKETFFRLNRFVLLGCMLLAFAVPLLHVPQQMSFRKMPSQADIITATTLQNTAVQLTEKNVPALIENAEKNSSINFQQVMQWAVYLYWFGVILFALNFLMQAGVLLYKAYSKPVIKDGPFRIVEISGDKAPCSFGNNIFINPEKYDWETYSQVLLHEKIHIEQKHTLDLLLAEIVLIFQWFNPFAWQWRKELENNLEFFTDDTLLQQEAVEKESYQMSLLKVAAPHFPLSLTTNYNQSLLKKRLLMMNAKKSNVHTIWKYFFLLPLMVLFVCFFNEPIVNSQTLSSKAKPTAHPRHEHGMRTSGSWFATIKGDKVSMQFKSDDDDKSNNNNTFLLSEFSSLPKGTQGNFTLTREAGTMEFTGKFEGDNGMGKYKFVADKTYSDAMQKEGIGVTEDDGELVFFLLNIKQSYVQMLKKNGYNDLDKDKLIPLAALDISEAYISSIKEAGFKDISLDNLVPFKALNIDKTYIEEIRKAGYKNLDPEKVITFKAQGIDGKYIADFKSSAQAEKNNNGNSDDKDDAVIDNKNKNTDNNSKSDDGYDDVIAFKSLNIDKDFINSFKEVGYNNLANHDLIAMKSLGVTPEYVKGFHNAGFSNIKPDDLVALKSQNVTPALVKNYKDLGFDNVSLEDIVGATATGTTPSFIKSMRDKGHNMKSVDKYIALKSVLGN